MQIKVGGHAVGIMGLKKAMEDMAGEYGERPDDEVCAELLKRLSEKNYIPDRVNENYAKAFLREFKKFVGRPYEEETSEGVEIKVLGPGCVQCDRLEQELIKVIAAGESRSLKNQILLGANQYLAWPDPVYISVRSETSQGKMEPRSPYLHPSPPTPPIHFDVKIIHHNIFPQKASSYHPVRRNGTWHVSFFAGKSCLNGSMNWKRYFNE